MKNKLSKKTIITAAISLVVLVLVGFAGKFIYDNYIGFTDVDFTDLVFADYNQETFATNVELDWVGNYYNANGYYDDFTKKLTDTGLYTKDQIDNYIPKLDSETYTDIASIYQDYDLSTEKTLKNGDEVEVTINYDKDLAKEKKIKVTNNVLSFKIKGLYERVKASDITVKAFDQVGGVAQLKKDATDDSDDFFEMGHKITDQKVYLEGVDQSGNTANAYQKLDVLFSEEDSYTNLDIEPDYYVCNRQFNVYKVNGNVKLEDANDGDMYCIEGKSIDKATSTQTKLENLQIENPITEVKLQAAK